MDSSPKRKLDIALIAIFVLSLVALVLANEDPFARDAVCAYTGFCPVAPHAKMWNKIVYDLAVAALVTLVFYFLVVWMPDYQRRQRLEQSLKRHYAAFREDCIEIMLLLADGGYSSDVPETLMEQDKFRDYFMEEMAPGLTRWEKFLNNINERYLRELLTRMEIFRDEVAFVLNNTEIPEDEPFEFLKQLSNVIYSMKYVKPEYDDEKTLARFLWNVFAGWDWSTGYRKEDIIKSMIDAI